MKLRPDKWREGFILVVALVLAAAMPAKAAEPNWPNGPYNYFVVDQDVRTVLQEFGRHLNLPVRVSDNVGSTRLKGKLAAPSAKAFLQWVCDSYRLIWYFDGVVLHVIPEAEARNEFLDLGIVPVEEFKKRLEIAGVADSRFPIRSTADERFVTVAGPPAHTVMVRRVLASMIEAAMAMPAPITLAESTPDRGPTTLAEAEPVRHPVPKAQAPAQKEEPLAKAREMITKHSSIEDGEPLRAQPRDGLAAASQAVSAATAGDAPNAKPQNIANAASAAAAVTPQYSAGLRVAVTPQYTYPPAQQPQGPASAATSTAWQNMGIDVRLMSAEQKKRLPPQGTQAGQNATGDETKKVIVFRGGR